MSKKKSASSGPTELEFISSLPLEESLKVLGALHATDTPVLRTRLNDDSWQFFMYDDDPQTGTRRAYVVGEIRRWQGTLTRLEASGEQLHENLDLSTLITGVGCLSVLLVVGGLLAHPAIYNLSQQLEPLMAGFRLLLFAECIFLLTLGMAGLVLFLNWAARHDNRGSGRLLQKIYQGFKLAGDVSRTEAGLNPDDDPGVEAVVTALNTRPHRSK